MEDSTYRIANSLFRHFFMQDRQQFIGACSCEQNHVAAAVYNSRRPAFQWQVLGIAACNQYYGTLKCLHAHLPGHRSRAGTVIDVTHTVYNCYLLQSMGNTMKTARRPVNDLIRNSQQAGCRRSQ